MLHATNGRFQPYSRRRASRRQGAVYRTALPVLGGAGVLTGFFLLANNAGISENYRMIWIMPFVFSLIAWIMSALPKSDRRGFGYTFLFFTTMFFVRLVITPLLIGISGLDYTGQYYISVTQQAVTDAIYLIAYESLVTSIFFLIATHFLTGHGFHAGGGSQSSLSGSRIIYGLVAFLGVTLILVWGVPSGLLNFLQIREGTVEMERGAGENLLIQIMLGGAWIAFLLVASWASKRYQRRRRNVPLFIALVAGALLVMIIFGHRRSVQIYTALAVISTLLACFPSRKKLIIVGIVSTMILTIVYISVWRGLTRHGMELASLNVSTTFAIGTIATYFQSYTGGPFQIAAANNILVGENIGWTNLLFDFVRSIFPVNMFVDRSTNLSSELLNLEIYQGKQTGGWLIFTTSYGYAMFGALMSPTFLILNVSLAMMTESLLRRSRGIEFKFLFTYLFARISIFPFIATHMLLTFYTLQLFTIGLIFFWATAFKAIDSQFKKQR